MKRRSFLKYLGIGVATATIAPALVAVTPVEPKPTRIFTNPSKPVMGPGLMEQIDNQEREVVIYTGRAGREQFYKAIQDSARDYNWDLEGNSKRKVW